MPKQTSSQPTNPKATAQTRRTRAARVIANAKGKTPNGLHRVDFREPTAQERAFGKSLGARARRFLSRKDKGSKAVA
jgi:hypothetical protein